MRRQGWVEASASLPSDLGSCGACCTCCTGQATGGQARLHNRPLGPACCPQRLPAAAPTPAAAQQSPCCPCPAQPVLNQRTSHT